MRTDSRGQLIRAQMRIPPTRGEFVNRTALPVDRSRGDDLRALRLFDIPQIDVRFTDRRHSLAIRFPLDTERRE